MYGIEVRESGVGSLVELREEFDLFFVEEMKRKRDEATTRLGRALVDLSEITFPYRREIRPLERRTATLSSI